MKLEVGKGHIFKDVCHAKEFDIYSKSREENVIVFTREVSACVTQKRNTIK